MNLTELKQKPIAELLETANEMGLENVSRSRKQDIIFVILKRHAKNGADIYGDGVLEILQDGFGFLRSADSSYLAGPDDIYVSPSQIRRFNLRTGDTVAGKIRPPKDGERYFALLKISEINFSKPESSKNKILFENLTPLFPQDRLELQLGNGSTEDLSARVIDLTSPIGKGQRGLIVSPPKAGKSLILQNIAQSITKNNPTAVIGGIVPLYKKNYNFSNGELLIAEADESDGSLVKFNTDIGIITNIELEHTDCYEDIYDLQNAFTQFANASPFYGAVIIGNQSPAAADIIQNIKRPVITFGLTKKSDFYASDITHNKSETTFAVFYKQKRLTNYF